MEVISKDYVERELKRYKTPGMGLGVIKDGKVLTAGGFGFRDLDTAEPIDADTVWGIASCSKSFTAALIGMLADDGVLDMDTPVRDMLADFRMYDPVASSQCTLRDMLCHRTGLASYDAVWSDVTIKDRAELWSRLKYLKPNLPFRYKAQYNNYMIDIAAHVAEKLSGRSWDDMVRERIFEPLGMTRSSTTLAELVASDNKARPYWPGEDGPAAVDFWNSDVGSPAGGINSTVNDMLKWLQFNLSEGLAPDGRRLMRAETMRDIHMQNMRYVLWPWDFPELSPVGGYAMGWYNENYRGEPMYWHLGEIEGYGTLQCCLPRSGLGIIMFNNLHAPDILIQCSVLYTVIDNVLGLEPRDWASRMYEQRENRGNMYGDWKLDLAGGKADASAGPAHLMDSYCGRYFEPGHGTAEIKLEEGELCMYWRGRREALIHHSCDVFRAAEVKMDTLMVNAPVIFRTRVEDGGVEGFGFKLYAEVEPIEFKRIQ